MAPAEPRPRKGGPRRKKKRGRPLYAAVDLGTNNCRLLIAERQGERFRVVDSFAQLARLGEGLEASGRLSDEAQDRAIEALGLIRDKLKAKRVGRVRCIATEACRRASNGKAFAERVHEATGLSLKIIDAEEEASLALIGCRDLIESKAERVAVIDVGGGSTEISLVDAVRAREGGSRGVIAKPPILAWTSLPIGVITVWEPFSDLPEDEAYAAMVRRAGEVLDGCPTVRAIGEAVAAGGAVHLIGTSGTVTCLAGVHQGLTRYRRDKVDGHWMQRGEAAELIARLRDLGENGRAELPTIGRERAALMLSGCAILEAIWERLPAERLRVADRGLREGLLLSMMSKGGKPGKRGGGGGKGKGKGRGKKSGKPQAAAAEAASPAVAKEGEGATSPRKRRRRRRGRKGKGGGSGAAATAGGANTATARAPSPADGGAAHGG